MKKFFSNRYVQAIGAVILSVLMVIVGQLVGALFTIPMHMAGLATGLSAWTFAGEYFMFIGIWLVVILFCVIRKKNRPMLQKLGKGGAGNGIGKSLLIGLPLGFGLNLLCALIAVWHGDIQLSFSEFNPWFVLLFIFCVAVQSGAEELTDRFYLYQKISGLFPEWPILPMIVTAVVFSSMHLLNPGITVLSWLNIALDGILYAMVIYYYDSFWGCVIAHTGWNFCQSILLGLPNSGKASAYSIFVLNQETAKNSFAYNTSFGIEGTVASSVVLAIAVVVIFLLGRHKKAKEKAAAAAAVTEAK